MFDFSGMRAASPIGPWETISRFVAMAAAASVLCGAIVRGGNDVGGNDVGGDRPATWTIPDDRELEERFVRFLDRNAVDEGVRARAVEAYAAGSGSDRLGRVVAGLAVVEPRVAALAAVRPPETFKPADLAWLKEPSGGGAPGGSSPENASKGDASGDPFLRESVRLHVARHLVRCGLFDDAKAMLEGLDARTSVDPATLLFLMASCQHWLLDADAAAETLDRLLEHGSDLPVRYERLATLMRKDLDSLEDDSLDHIARRMRDITRRLSFGRAGPGTRSVQDGVIESLDKLIAKIEQEQSESQGQGGGSGGGSGSGSGARPMQDSMPAGGKGPGEVTKRDIGAGDGWGALPPHEREEALQQIGREFPPHYREAIEQYFKRLASGENGSAAPRKVAAP